METYIQISKINDFIFCPYSLYYHSIYENFSQKVYHQSPQVKGKIKHEAIDKGKYSTSKNYLQGISVYCDQYGLAGKIDIYDQKNKTLIERKNKISKIYDGQKYQLYAQYFCLLERGYEVEKLKIHSLTDNKRYEIDLPVGDDLKKFENVIEQIKNFNFKQQYKINPAKCDNCIYAELCVFKKVSDTQESIRYR